LVRSPIAHALTWLLSRLDKKMCNQIMLFTCI
jgi:hypothetical protein